MTLRLTSPQAPSVDERLSLTARITVFKSCLRISTPDRSSVGSDMAGSLVFPHSVAGRARCLANGRGDRWGGRAVGDSDQAVTATGFSIGTPMRLPYSVQLPS